MMTLGGLWAEGPVAELGYDTSTQLTTQLRLMRLEMGAQWTLTSDAIRAAAENADNKLGAALGSGGGAMAGIRSAIEQYAQIIAMILGGYVIYRITSRRSEQ